MSPKKATQKSAESTTASGRKSKGFTDEERAAEGARPRGEGGSSPRPARGQGGRGKPLRQVGAQRIGRSVAPTAAALAASCCD
jgi:hypothetical protein